MNYDFVGVIGLFIVISIWAYVLFSIIDRIISSDNDSSTNIIVSYVMFDISRNFPL